MRYMAVATLLLVLTGCATPYQANGAMGGFSETWLAEDMVTVRFNGNAYTSVEQSTDYALLRSAELCSGAGYGYMGVLSSSEGSQTTGVYYNPYGNYASAQAKPNSAIQVECLVNDQTGALNASFIENSIRTKWEIEQP